MKLDSIDDSTWYVIENCRFGVTPCTYCRMTLEKRDKIADKFDRREMQELMRWCTGEPPRAIDAGLLDTAVAHGVADMSGLLPLGRSIARKMGLM